MVVVQAQVSETYQVVIPDEVCQKLDLQPHSVLLFLIDDGAVMLRLKPASFTDTLRRLHQSIWQDVNVEEWLKLERDTWELAPAS